MTCQERGTAACTGGCTAACKGLTGALFCNFGNGLGNQYIDVTVTDLPSCVSALESSLHINIAASGLAACQGSNCKVNGSLSGCAVSASTMGTGTGTPLPGTGLAVGLGIALAGVVRRKRA